MNLVKTSMLSFVATFVKLLAGLVINKSISLFVGPSGLAAIGHFQNSTALLRTVSQGGINNGVIKYTAEKRMESDALTALWSTSLKITICFSSFVGIFLVFGSSYLAEYIFKDERYSYVFILFGFTTILFSINQLLLSILNGLKEIRTYISAQITQSIYSLAVTSLLIYFFHLDGALIALVTNQSFIFFVILWKLRNHKDIIFYRFFQNWNSGYAKKLLSYSSMAFVTASILPISQIIIRDNVVDKFGWDYAGYWQAVTYISNMYLMVITTALSTYYLPRLSELTNKSDIKKELVEGYKIIIPIVSFLALSIYALKSYIIMILFTNEFRPMEQLFKWQLIGDVVKISSWLLAYLMLAKAMTKTFIITEVLFSLSYVVFCILFTDMFGFVGLSYAFAFNYLLYLLVMIFIMKNKVIG